MIKSLLEKQKEYFGTGATLDVSFRKKSLKKLLSVIKKEKQKLRKRLLKILRSHFSNLLLLKAELLKMK